MNMEPGPKSTERGPKSTERGPINRYFSATRSATYGVLAGLPLFLLYETFVVLVNEGRLEHIRVGADVWIKNVMATVGQPGLLGTVVLLFVIGVYVAFRERRQKIPIRASWFGFLVLESMLYAVVLAFLVSTVVGAVFSMDLAGVPLAADLAGASPAAQDAGGSAVPPGRITMLVLSIGAGLYEELVFRVALVGGLFLVLRRFMNGSRKAYVTSALIGAFIFSLVHYLGAYGDPFLLSSFTFRFLFGLALNGLFLVRGFGVAAWTHALYDVMVVAQMPSS